MGQQNSKPTITDQDRAILQLKRQRDAIKQYQKRLSVVIEKQQTLASESLKQGNREKAKFFLRSKKHQQSVIETTYGQLENLENLIGTIEFKLIEKDVLYGLQQGNATLQKLNGEMSVDKIDRILDDLNEETLKVDEVSEMLGMGLSNRDESEVDEEFARLEQQTADQAADRQTESGGTEKGNKESGVIGDTGDNSMQLPEAPKEQPMPEAPRDAPKEAPKESEKEKEKPKEALTA